MAATTANKLIAMAMEEARIIHPSDSIPYGKAKRILDKLNDLLESWSLEKLMVVANVLESFTLTPAVAEYTYYDGGTFDSDRPIEIMDECFIRSGSTDSACVLKTLDVYRRMASKDTQGTPRIIAYNPEYPQLKVFLWPTPSDADDIHIRAAKGITSFARLTTAVDLMPGYRRAIYLNLAMEISNSYGKKVSRKLEDNADEAKKNIKSANAIPVKPMRTPHLTAMAGGGSAGAGINNPF